MFLSQMRYWTYQGLSRPNRARMESMVSGLTWGLSSIWDRKSPGAICMTTKVKSDIPRSTGIM